MYELQLSANDGQLIGSDILFVTVTTGVGNLPPVVDAGTDQAITLPASATLSGSVTDDGTHSVLWTKRQRPRHRDVR